MLSLFCSPSRYIQGRNATAQLGGQLAALKLSGPVFILASPRIQKLLDDTWHHSLTEAGYEYTVVDFAGECSDTAIDTGTQQATSAGAQVIIGAGGGKTLDTARAIAANLHLPVVNCPTVASSDAPCSALSVVYGDDGSFDRYIFYPKNPDLVLVDTSIIAAAPVRTLVSGMGDALATWYEARTVIEAHQPNQVHGGTTITAQALAQLCATTLYNDGLAAKQACEVSAVTPALERIVEANTLLSGLGFESGGLAIAHSVHNGLTIAKGTHSYMHGEKVAFGLLVQVIVEGRPTEELRHVTDFCRAVGLPTTLREIGIPKDDQTDDLLQAIANRTVADGETAHHEPFTVTSAMIEDGIRAANEWGENY